MEKRHYFLSQVSCNRSSWPLSSLDVHRMRSSPTTCTHKSKPGVVTGLRRAKLRLDPGGILGHRWVCTIYQTLISGVVVGPGRCKTKPLHLSVRTHSVLAQPLHEEPHRRVFSHVKSSVLSPKRRRRSQKILRTVEKNNTDISAETVDRRWSRRVHPYCSCRFLTWCSYTTVVLLETFPFFEGSLQVRGVVVIPENTGSVVFM